VVVCPPGIGFGFFADNGVKCRNRSAFVNIKFGKSSQGETAQLEVYTDNTATVVSVERAFIILNLLTNNPQGMGPREIGRALGYGAGAVQKILNTLLMQHVVNKKPRTDKYILGMSAVRLAQQIIAQTNFVTVIRPSLEDLAERTGETAFLAVREDLAVVYVDKVVSTHELRVDPPLGVSRPLNATAVGQLLLAFASEDLIPRLFEAGAIVAASEYSITNPDDLRQRKTAILRDGYAHDSREFLVSSSSLAAPIFDEGGQISAAIAICGPAERFDSQLNPLRDALLAVAGELYQALGYVPRE
jgi:DNA-binding IclR family transcriptional regulator